MTLKKKGDIHVASLTSDSSRYLKLENITIKFHLPCVMDIKIGKVTWEDDATKALKERRKKNWPLRDLAGFSIVGYMVCTLSVIVFA